MSTPEHFKIACANCQGHIEFPKELHGQPIDCPHCGLTTVLRVPGYVEPSPPPIPPVIQKAPDAGGTQPIIYVAALQPQIVPIQTAPTSPESALLLPEMTDESLRSIQARSSDGEHYYTVNLIDYTCTCPSFLEVHYKAPPRDFGRICKHICSALNRPEILPLLNPMCKAMVEEGFGVYPGRFGRDENGNIIYITGANTAGWINVFALKRRDGRKYYRFGYNLSEQRWAYGSSPKINDRILHPERNAGFSPPSSSGLGWRILRGFCKGMWQILRLVVVTTGIIFTGVLADLFASGKKSRRRRSF